MRKLSLVLCLLLACSSVFAQKITPVVDPTPDPKNIIESDTFKIEYAAPKVDLPNGGQSVFVRVWDKISDEQYGFGPDHTVDVERMDHYGVGRYVPDPLGPFTAIDVDEFGKKTTIHYREDPEAALLLRTLHTLRVHPEKQLGAHILSGKVGQSTCTQNSAAGAADPVDGYAERGGITDSFATIRAGNGTASSATDATRIIRMSANVVPDTYTELRRGLSVFDTSCVATTDTVSAAVLSYIVDAKTSGLGSPSFSITTATLASNSAIANGDFQTSNSSTSFGSVAYASVSTAGGFTDVALNASGIAAINKGASARTAFAVKIGWDADNSTTGLTWASSADSGFSVKWADTALTTSDPVIVITHAPSTSIPSVFGLLNNQQ